MASYDLGYLFLAVAIFGKAVWFVNNFPMVFKAKVMGGESQNLRANMYVYKQIGSGAGVGAVVLEEEGDVGVYNRANRSMHHMVENMAPLVMSVPLAGFVFPYPTFVATCVFSVGRVMHMVGYTSKYGKHALGFVLATFATEALVGMCALTGLKALGFMA